MPARCFATFSRAAYSFSGVRFAIIVMACITRSVACISISLRLQLGTKVPLFSVVVREKKAMDRALRCLHCGKRLVPAHVNGRTELVAWRAKFHLSSKRFRVVV